MVRARAPRRCGVGGACGRRLVFAAVVWSLCVGGEAGRRARRPADLRLTVAPVTAQRYGDHLDSIEGWLERERFPCLVTLARIPRTCDVVLTAYVQWLFDAGLPISWGSYGLAAVQLKFPFLRTHLRGAWSAQKRWGVVEPSHVRVPLPVPVLLAMAVLAWGWGWKRTSALLLLGFDAMLRPGELCGLLRLHLRLPEEIDPGIAKGVVCLGETKTSTRAAKLQSVVVADPLVLQLLTCVFGKDEERVLICPSGKKGIDRRFGLLTEALGVSRWFSPGCLRGGGAVAFFQATGSLGQLQFKGRWECQNKLLHYLQKACRRRRGAIWGQRRVERSTTWHGALPSCFPPLVQKAGVSPCFDWPRKRSVEDVGWRMSVGLSGGRWPSPQSEAPQFEVAWLRFLAFVKKGSCSGTRVSGREDHLRSRRVQNSGGGTMESI